MGSVKRLNLEQRQAPSIRLVITCSMMLSSAHLHIGLIHDHYTVVEETIALSTGKEGIHERLSNGMIWTLDLRSNSPTSSHRYTTPSRYALDRDNRLLNKISKNITSFIGCVDDSRRHWYPIFEIKERTCLKLEPRKIKHSNPPSKTVNAFRSAGLLSENRQLK